MSSFLGERVPRNLLPQSGHDEELWVLPAGGRFGRLW